MNLATSLVRLVHGNAASLGHTGGLRLRIGWADVRIQAAGGRCHRIRWDRRLRREHSGRLVVIECLDQLHLIEIPFGVLKLLQRHR